MKIQSDEFRVRPGKKVKLSKWPTLVKPVYAKKRDYEKRLQAHVQELSSLQQLLYADEVRSLADLHIEHVPVSAAELKLALQIIEQGTEDAYDPSAYENEEKKRILAAIDRKIEGKEVVTHEPQDSESGAQVIDLMEALRASLSKSGAKPKSATRKPREAPAEVAEIPAPRARKPAQRAEKAVAPAPAAKVRARK